jgi:hypothetical protein
MLQGNTFNQSMTVRDLIADQVLYNLALCYDYYYSDTDFNGIPSFVRISTGTAQTQRTATGSLGAKATTKISGGELDPSIGATLQNQDNWGLIPVADIGELQRLHDLYSTQFKTVSQAEWDKKYPKIIPVDASNKPLLTYKARLNPTNAAEVLMTADSTQATFTATVPGGAPALTLRDIPGADGHPWFTFNQCDKGNKAIFAGTFNHHKIWILDKENFFQFAILTLGTNSVGTSAATPLHISNGFLVQ